MQRSRPVGDVGRILLGLVVVAVGVLFLLDSAGVLDAGEAIGDWWPAALIALGLLELSERPHGAVSSLVLIAAGIVLLLFTTDVLDDDAWDTIWPLAVIAGGVLVLTRWRGSGAPSGEELDAAITATGIFGGPHVRSSSQAFRRASLTAIFGGVTLDLRAARPAPEGATVTATAAFGGIDIVVPRGWRITTRSTPFFGGVDDKTDPVVEIAADAPSLHVDALAVFGGVEVKHAKE